MCPIILKQLCCKSFRSYHIGPGVHSQSSLPPIGESSLMGAAHQAANAETAFWCCQFPKCRISSILCSVRWVCRSVAHCKVSQVALALGFFSPTWAAQLRWVHTACWWAELGAQASLPRDKLRGFLAWGLVVTRAPLSAPLREMIKKERREISCLRLNHVLQDPISCFSLEFHLFFEIPGTPF